MYTFAAMQKSCGAKSAAFFKKFKKIVGTLRVNETKVPSRKGLIDNRFAL